MKTYRTIISTWILTCLVLLCCKNVKKQQVLNEKEIKDTINIKNNDQSHCTNKGFKKEYRSGTYSLTIESNNEEVSIIKIYSKGLPYEYEETFEIEGQIKEAHMTDLNQDGFKEYILEIMPTDDSGNINLKGFASNRDKSLSEIYIVEPNELKDVNTDRVIVEKSSIVRHFKLNGILKSYSYILSEGESSYVLSLKEQ